MKNILIAGIIGIISITHLSAETIVDVYEMSYAEADALGSDYQKIYNKTLELAPVTTTTYDSGKLTKRKKNFHSKDVSIVFVEGKNNVEKFNILIEAIAKFSRLNMKNRDGVGMSKMLLELKQ